MNGANDKSVAKFFSVTAACFVGWKKRYKSVRYAIKRADLDRKKTDTLDFTDYISSRLPDHLKPTWDRITAYSQEQNGYSKVEKLLKNEPAQIRKELVAYSLLLSGFSLSKALRKVAVSESTFRHWIETDPEFGEILKEVDGIKKDFFEEGLIKLIRSGDSPATIFANRTYNRDRGYGEVLETRYSATLTVQSLPLQKLNLPANVLRVLLDAVKLNQRQKRLPVESKAIDDTT